MRTRPVLTADDARRMLDAARAEAERHGWNVSMAIVDAGGFVLALERLDRAAPFTAEVARQKAWTAAVTGFPTKTLEDMVKERPGMVTMAGLTRVQGGLPIKVDGECVGAVGVSGATSPEDEQVAVAAIAALE